MKYLLDTNVCIDAMQGHAAVLEHFAQVSPSDCCVSSISRYELMVGVLKCKNPKRERAKVTMLLNAVKSLVFDDRAADVAGQMRAQLEEEGRMIGPYDILLAAQARAYRLRLVSANVDEFGRIADLEFESWRRVMVPDT